MKISNVVSIDFETRAVLDLRKTGVHPYAVHPLTDVWCLSYGSEPENITCYVPSRAEGRLPVRLIEHVQSGGMVSGWNVGFELAIWNRILAPRYGFPILKPEQCIDTQVMAQARGFPKALGDCAEAMRLGVLKDAEGSRLMMQMCKPRRIEKDGTVVWWDDEDKLNRLVAYCDQDVRTEMEIFHKLPALSQSEQDQWLLNHRINERGVPIDLKLVNGAIKIVKEQVDLLNQELAGITGGLVPRATAVKKIMAFLVSRGVPVGETLDRFDVAELLIQDIDPVAKRVLQIRQEVGKSSVGKLQAMKHRVSSDGRIRGTLKFHGASSTGRWTSAGVQFQNLPRDSVKPPAVIDLIIDEDRDGVDLFSTRNVMPTISAALRNMIAPKPGRVLLVVDYAQIESRAVAYLADDQPKLDVFRQGRDIYKQVGSGMFGLPESEVVDDVRQASKVAELACFSADTRVITDSGIKQIVDVSTSDLLWDGESWIHHSGVLSRGLQHTISLQGVRVTQDHLVETGRTWSRAGLLASNPRHLHRALVTGLAGMWSLVTMSGPQVAWSMSSALATAGQPVTGWLFTTSGGVLVTSARSAPDGRRQTLVWNETDFQPSCRISNIDEGYPTDWPPQKTDAITPKTRALKTTEPEGYSSRMSGAGALRGLRLSSSMSLLLRGGMIPLLKWTVSMLMAGIARAISGSSLAQSTWLTSGLLKRCKAESCLLNRKSQTLEPVFDIWNAGPNHKFMILSDAGPLIVHNCGFGGGPGALAAMATNYGLDFTEDERVDLVKRWRDANQKAKKLWYELKDAAMSAMRNPGIPFQACRGKVAYEKVGNSLRCRLPSGRVIVYPWAEIKDVTAPWSTPEKPETIEAIIYEGISGSGQPVKKADTGKSTKWVKRAAWHGILCENVVQAMCSDLLREALVALERKGFKVIFHVHDEIVVETGADGAEAKLAEMIEVMTDVPLWATGMPIDAEGHVMARYGK